MKTPPRILIVVTQQLGDVLLATPLVVAARARWPDARIDVLGFAGTLGLLQGNPMVSTLIEARRGGWRNHWALLRRIGRRYDIALVTQSGDRAFIYGLVAAPVRSALVPLTGPGRGWKRAVSTHRLLGDPQRHSVLEKLELLRPWVDLDTLAPALVPPAPQPLDVELAGALRPGLVVVHVPSMWRYKQWPVAHYRVLVAGLVDAGHQVVLTGDRGDHDRALVAQVRDVSEPPEVIDACGRLTLAQVATLLAQAAAYVGPDTSVTHLAAAVGTPLVTLFGPTTPLNWGPWPAGHPARQPWQARGAEPDRAQQAGIGRRRIVILQGPSLPGRDCVPCRRQGCEDRRDSPSHCLEELPPGPVLAQVLALIAQTAGA